MIRRRCRRSRTPCGSPCWKRCAPDSAAGVARRIGQSRQAVNYHVKELRRAGSCAGRASWRKGNFVEQLVEAVGGTFVVGPRLAWSEDRRAALRSQLALDQLVTVSERVQRDAGVLLDRGVLDGAEVPSASVVVGIRFADEQAVAAFLAEYVTLVRESSGATAPGAPAATPSGSWPPSIRNHQEVQRDQIRGWLRSDVRRGRTPWCGVVPAGRPRRAGRAPVAARLRGCRRRDRARRGRPPARRKVTEPCAGTEIVVVLVDAATGRGSR